MAVTRKVNTRFVDSDWEYVSQHDDAHAASADDFARYFETHDESVLKLSGEPTRFRLRPLTREEVSRLVGIENAGERYAEACKLALRRISGFIVRRGEAEESITLDIGRAGPGRELLDKLGPRIIEEVGQAAYFSARLSESF